MRASPGTIVILRSAGDSLGTAAAIRRHLPLTLLWSVAWAAVALLVFGVAALAGALTSHVSTGWTLLGVTLGYGIMGGACGCVFASHLQEFPVRRDPSSLPGRRGTILLSLAATLALAFAGARLSVALLGLRSHGMPVLLLAGFGHMVLGALSGTATMAIARRGGRELAEPEDEARAVGDGVGERGALPS